MQQTLRAQMHHAMGGGKQDCQRYGYRDGSAQHDIVETPRFARLLLSMPAKHPCLGVHVGPRGCSKGALRRRVSGWHR